MKWTEQQQNAIDARGSSIIVSAAAGSGKTAVLTERLVQLISDPESGVRADRIVVVTFTNDAAAELKKRLDMKLRELISTTGGSPYLLKQQTLLQSAKISTINSFCFDFLRDNITDQGITSGFGVLDEPADKVIRSQAMEELLDILSRDDYERISYLYDVFCIKDQQSLVNAITTLDKFLSSVAIREKWLDTAVSEYKKPFEESVYYDDLFRTMEKKCRKALHLAEVNLASVKDIFTDMTIKQAVNGVTQATAEVELAERILSIARQRRFPTEEECALVSKFPTVFSVTGVKDYNRAVRTIYGKRRDEYKELLKSAVSGLASARGDYEESGRAAEELAYVVRRYHQLIWDIKCSKNSISFDDGERLALEILADFDENGRIIQSETAKRTAEHYDIIMIDEYQDSNNKEDLIFKLISKSYKHDAQGRPMYGENAFLVGDVKQSIYGFRLANPRNFRTVMETSGRYSRESTCPNQYILLNNNFRSSPQVIDFINYVFREIMSVDCGDIDYTDDEKLYFSAPQYKEGDPDSRRTKLIFMNTDPVDEDDPAYFEDEEKPEAEITAERIARMIADGVMVTDGNGNERACRPSDFAILVRSNKETKPFEKALQRRGIAARGSEEKGYLKSHEIAILIDLLRVIANPLLDVPMAAVLTSPMYMFTIQELAILRTKGKDKSLFTLLSMASKGELEGISPQLSARCGIFLRAVERFRLDSITMTIGELISSIYDTTDFISVMQLFKDGEKKRANLRALIQHAQNYETFASADGTGGLSGFLRHIDRISESGDYEQGRSAASSGEYVYIMTDHKSKGLEFPFVFIGETAHRFKFDHPSVVCSDDGRIGFVLHNKNLARKYRTFQQIMLTEDMERSTRSEEMRLFYVALTRAKQQLFINLDAGEKTLGKISGLIDRCIINGGIGELITEANSVSDWLWLCLMMHGDMPAIADLIGLDVSDLGFPAPDVEEKLFDIEYSDGAASAFELAAEETVKSEPDEDIVAELAEIIASPYDRTLSQTTAKLSVTQISKKFREDEKFDFHLQRPKFIAGKQKLTGAERGTALHTFFQYCDFDSAETDIPGETERMREHGFLTRKQAEVIAPEKVGAFFRSGLYRRIRGSQSFERERKFTVAASQLNIDDPVFDRLSRSEGMIKGIIDLLFREDDGIVIVDYKSDRGLTADELKERYTKQLEIYKSAIELTTGVPVKELWLYSIELEKEIRLA